MTTKTAGWAHGFERSTSWRRVALIGTLTFAVAAGALVTHAQAQGGMWGGSGAGPGMMKMTGGQPERWARHLDRMLDGLGVTDAQRVQIRRIAMAAGADLRAQHEAGRGLRDRGMQLFTAPTVDASGAETLRQQIVTQQDQSSKRMLQAMLDIAQVLTPEQRAKIGARARERQAVMHDRMQRMRQAHREGGEGGHGERPPHGPGTGDRQDGMPAPAKP